MAPREVKRKRQARGEVRIQSLLVAAEAVFARVGYSKATTNEIAAEAEVSPATLYQFFKNKEELANAVALKYVEGMGQHHENLDYMAIAKVAYEGHGGIIAYPAVRISQDASSVHGAVG